MTDLKGQRILVTGGAGFLGRHVCSALAARDPAFVHSPRSRNCDLRDRLAVRRVFCEVKPTIVFHLAAVCGGIQANRDNPGSFLHDNAVMGLQVMEEARRWNVKKYVQVGTVCSYPKHCPAPFREEAIWDGYPEETNAPYGLAKRLLIAQAAAYRQQYGLNAISLLPANLYGPGDNFDSARSHVIPALIRKAIAVRDVSGDRLSVWGDGSATREFLFVEDAAEGIVAAAERYDGAEPVNLGTGRETSIADLVAMICRLVGLDAEISWEPTQPNGQPRRCLDRSRALEAFGWAARTELEDGLRRTIAWWAGERVRQLQALEW